MKNPHKQQKQQNDGPHKADERIDAVLLDGLDSGEPIPVTQEDWDERKRRLVERLGQAICPH
jgi:antitoxin ParD1/3/4